MGIAEVTEGREVEPGSGEEAVEEAGAVLHPPELGPDQLLRHGLGRFTTAGSELEAAAAMAMAPVADITCQRGDYDEALRMASAADHRVTLSQGGG